MLGLVFIKSNIIDGRTEKIELAQSSVNSYMTYNMDKKDFWDNTCPIKGDCEDFALCKSRKLQSMGINPKDLKIVVGVVSVNSVSMTHAVLVVEDSLVLDNLHKDVIEKDVYYKDFEPMYTCHSDSGNITIHGNNLMILLTKNSGIQHFLQNKCEAALIERSSI